MRNRFTEEDLEKHSAVRDFRTTATDAKSITPSMLIIIQKVFFHAIFHYSVIHLQIPFFCHISLTKESIFRIIKMVYYIVMFWRYYAMKNRIISLTITLLVIVLLLTGCGKTAEEKAADERNDNLKIGVVLSGNEKDTYADMHLKGISAMKESCGLSDDKVVIKQGITEENCLSTLTALVDEGCNLVFAAGDNLEDYIVQAATEKENVQFCYADGNQSITNGLSNYHNYSVATFGSRYLTGIIAGMKLNDMIESGEITDSETKIGYIGSVAGSQSRSDYTAFYLGAKSVCKSVTMEVQYSGKNNSENLERIAANALMANGSILIAQQGYLNGAAETCEKNGKYFVGCDSPATDKAPNFALTSTKLDWAQTYVYGVNTYITEGKLPTSWSKGAADDSIGYCDINAKAFSSEEQAKKAETKANEALASLKSGDLKVFETTTWTVNEEKITTTASDELQSLYGGKEYIDKKGFFMENELVSYPMFNFIIDGITELNA